MKKLWILCRDTLAAIRRSLTSVGVVDSSGSMRRRLQAMTTLTPWSKRRLIFSATLLTACAAIGLIPWRLVAQTSASPPISQSPPQAGPTSIPSGTATIDANSAHFDGGVTLTSGDTTVRADSVDLRGPMRLTTATAPANAPDWSIQRLRAKIIADTESVNAAQRQVDLATAKSEQSSADRNAVGAALEQK